MLRNRFHQLLVGITFVLASPALAAPVESPYVHFNSILTDSTRPPAARVYQSILENFRLHHARIPFPHSATDIAASYRRFQPRDIFNAAETYSLLEVLNGTDPDHPLDAGPNLAGDRQQRLRDLIAWNLWLVSREGVNHHWNHPLGPAVKDGPYLEGRLRGWGSQNFKNSSSDFSGWHTYSEQTSQPLIALFQTVMALELFMQQNRELADQPVFTRSQTRAFRQSGYMTMITPTITDDVMLSGCAAAVEACRYNYDNLTYRQAAALFRAFGGAVLDWWIANGMTRAEGLHYFWYTARGDRNFASTGIPARNWFIVHANMLMGRAAFLYANLTGKTAYSDLTVQLYRGFLAAHHTCRQGKQDLTCYHYGVLGKPLADLTHAGKFGTADPGDITTTPERALEEPYHMNSSHAVLGLLHGKSLLNSRDMLAGDGEWLPQIQKTYLAAYRAALPAGPCFYFTPFQCANGFVTGPPVTRRRLRLFWEITRAPGTTPQETVTLGENTFHLPDYAHHGESLAAYFLTEGASEETFELLYQWWDGYARRVELGNLASGCRASATCRNAFDGSNFPKMGVYLAAAAYQNRNAVSEISARDLPAMPKPAPRGCGSAAGSAGDWLVMAGVSLLLLVRNRRL